MTRYALCIGIDQYPSPNTLNGCVSDATSWASILRAQGFNSVQMLTDQQATFGGFLGAVNQIVQTAVPGDVVVITYSGHGAKAPTVNGQMYAEGLVPIDFGTNGFIVDDDIGPIFDAARPNVAINFILDSCFSGGAKRFLSNAPTTVAPGAAIRIRRLIATPEMIQVHQAAHARRHQNRALTTPGLLRECIFAASADNQVSLENSNGGYFTQSAIRVLQSNPGQLSNSSFVSQVISLVGNLSPDFTENQGLPQHPQLRCPTDLQNGAFLGPIGMSTGTGNQTFNTGNQSFNTGNQFTQSGNQTPLSSVPLVTTGVCQLPQNPSASDLVAYLQCISATTRNFQGPNNH